MTGVLFTFFLMNSQSSWVVVSPLNQSLWTRSWILSSFKQQTVLFHKPPARFTVPFPARSSDRPQIPAVRSEGVIGTQSGRGVTIVSITLTFAPCPILCRQHELLSFLRFYLFRFTRPTCDAFCSSFLILFVYMDISFAHLLSESNGHSTLI